LVYIKSRIIIKSFNSDEIGGVDYVTKPFQKEELIARIENHLEIRRLTKALEQKNKELQEEIAKVKTLKGLLPICANCKKIRDDKGCWHQVEAYIRDHSEVDFSHSICPECMKELYPELF